MLRPSEWYYGTAGKRFAEFARGRDESVWIAVEGQFAEAYIVPRLEDLQDVQLSPLEGLDRTQAQDEVVSWRGEDVAEHSPGVKAEFATFPGGIEVGLP
jgi:hypothetical protein